MLRRLGRLFVIKNRWEAFAVIYALALGSVDRGFHYMERFPGVGGWLMFAACTGVVFMAGAKLLDHTKRDTGDRRRSTDAVPQADRKPAVQPRRRLDRHSSSPDHEEGVAGHPRGWHLDAWRSSRAAPRRERSPPRGSVRVTDPFGITAHHCGRAWLVVPAEVAGDVGSRDRSRWRVGRKPAELGGIGHSRQTAIPRNSEISQLAVPVVTG